MGETAGVKLEKHKLEFYMNGYRQTSVPLDTTDPVFGYVDVYGNTPTVSVFGKSFTERIIDRISKIGLLPG